MHDLDRWVRSRASFAPRTAYRLQSVEHESWHRAGLKGVAEPQLDTPRIVDLRDRNHAEQRGTRVGCGEIEDRRISRVVGGNLEFEPLPFADEELPRQPKIS